MKAILLTFQLAIMLSLQPSLAQNATEEGDPFVGRLTTGYAGYLEGCAETQIRCTWLGGSSDICNELVIDLQRSSTFTGRMTPTAAQNTNERRLSFRQVQSLKKITTNMPASADSDKLLDCVFITFWQGGRVEIKRYLRSNLPREIERIYDITDADIETGREATIIPAAEQTPLMVQIYESINELASRDGFSDDDASKVAGLLLEKLYGPREGEKISTRIVESKPDSVTVSASYDLAGFSEFQFRFVRSDPAKGLRSAHFDSFKHIYAQ